MKRIDRLESLLRGRQRSLAAQMAALQEQLALFGLGTAEEIAKALEKLPPPDRDTLLQQQVPAATPEQGLRATARRRMGRMV